MSEHTAQPLETNDSGNKPTGSQYLFRGDDEYRQGCSVGDFPLDSEEADNADVQTVWVHVRNKKTNERSRFVSFSEQLGTVGEAFAAKFSRRKRVIVKVRWDDLHRLVDEKVIRVYSPADVEELTRNHKRKK